MSADIDRENAVTGDLGGHPFRDVHIRMGQRGLDRGICGHRGAQRGNVGLILGHRFVEGLDEPLLPGSNRPK